MISFAYSSVLSACDCVASLQMPGGQDPPIFFSICAPSPRHIAIDGRLNAHNVHHFAIVCTKVAAPVCVQHSVARSP